MEIFSGDSEVIRKDIEYLINRLPSVSNYSDMVSIVGTLYTLIPEYENLIGSKTDYEDHIEQGKLSYRKANKYLDLIDNAVVDNFIKFKKFHYAFSKEVNKMLNEKLCEVDDFDYQDTNLTIVEQYGIIIDFFKSINSPEGINIFNQLINEKRIFSTNSYNSIDDGSIILNPFSKNETIYINKSEIDDIDTMVSIVHELGHAIDSFNLLRKYTNKELLLYETVGSPYIEVSSKLYEKRFIEYLIENNIYPGNAKYSLDEYYHSILDSSENQLFLSSLDDKYLKNKRYKKLPLALLTHNISKNSNIASDKIDTPIKDLCIGMENSYTYGSSIATYLSHTEKHDLEKYHRICDKFMAEKIKLFNPQVFDILETSPLDIVESIKEEIKILNKPKEKIKK